MNDFGASRDFEYEGFVPDSDVLFEPGEQESGPPTLLFGCCKPLD
jgi:hypothetical protein